MDCDQKIIYIKYKYYDLQNNNNNNMYIILLIFSHGLIDEGY